jgi:hypothetical protein
MSRDKHCIHKHMFKLHLLSGTRVPACSPRFIPDHMIQMTTQHTCCTPQPANSKWSVGDSQRSHDPTASACKKAWPSMHHMPHSAASVLLQASS